MMPTPSALHLLLVEDNTIDAMSVRRALQELGMAHRVIHVRTVEAALAYLASRVPEEPLLVLVDLGIPRMGGMHLLNAMKSDEALASIPVVVLAASNESMDVLESFTYSIAGYVVKPHDYAGLVATVRTIADYWALSQIPAAI